MTTTLRAKTTVGWFKKIFISICGLVAACSEPPSSLDRILAAGELRAAIVGSDACVTRHHRSACFESELLSDLADSLEIKLVLTWARNHQELTNLLRYGRVDLIATNAPPIKNVPTWIRFTTSYLIDNFSVICLREGNTPQNLGDLNGARVAVSVELLERFELRPLSRSWHIEQADSPAAQLSRLARGEIDFAILPNLSVVGLRAIYPELQMAFTLGKPTPRVWGMQLHQSRDFALAVNKFFIHHRQTNAFARLHDKHFHIARKFDYVAAQRMLRHHKTRLPAIRPLFEQAGRDTDIDWRLLAALSYQESHWDTEAISATGVRGLMMLTKPTAKSLQVDRLDPTESIPGGAKYFRAIGRRLPAHLPAPDRTWFALAAYNVGYGHVEDARVITESRGHDPNSWIDVRKYLPLLSDPSVAAKTRHGLARGSEPVRFVENIRRYFDALTLLNPLPTPTDSKFALWRPVRASQ